MKSFPALFSPCPGEGASMQNKSYLAVRAPARCRRASLALRAPSSASCSQRIFKSTSTNLWRMA